MTEYSPKAHEAYVEYLITVFKQSYNRTMSADEAIALAHVHTATPTTVSAITGISYQSFVDEFNETESMEPYLSMMRQDMSVACELSERQIEWICQDLVQVGWRKVNSENV